MTAGVLFVDPLFVLDDSWARFAGFLLVTVCLPRMLVAYSQCLFSLQHSLVALVSWPSKRSVY